MFVMAHVAAFTLAMHSVVIHIIFFSVEQAIHSFVYIKPALIQESPLGTYEKTVATAYDILFTLMVVHASKTEFPIRFYAGPRE